MRKRLGTFLVTVLLLTTCVKLGFGQEISTGSIVGVVTDQSDAAIPEVTITVTNLGTGAVRTTVTGTSGNYTLPLLPAGRYQIAASKEGFEKFVLENAPLQVAQTLTENISLKVGSVTQAVTVTAQLVAVDTKTAALGEVVGSQDATELPLNGRSFIQLATLAPGVTTPGNGQGESTTNGFGHPNVAVSVGGQREYTSEVDFDGIQSRDMVYGAVGFQIDVDSIAEFKVQDGFTPVTDQVSGKINVVTKSGTNSFHGAAWEFVRNDIWDARNFFDVNRLPYRQNEFGAAVGGPIIKNKLFFFVDYEGYRVRKGQPATGIAMTAAEIGGNFSSLSTPIIDPLTGLQFQGNIIPPSRQSHFATAEYNQYVPLANTTGALNRFVNEALSRNDDKGSVRIDFLPSEKDTVFGRYTEGNSPQFTQGWGFDSGRENDLNGRNAALGWTHTFGPNLVNSLTLGLNRVFNNPYLPPPTSVNYAQQFGLQNVTTFQECQGIPTLNLTGYNAIGPFQLCIFLLTNNIHFDDNISFTKGRHRITTGLQFTHLWLRQVVGVPTLAYFDFTGQYSGNAAADYLLGYPYTAQAQKFSEEPDVTAVWPAPYFGDEIQVTKKFTLNLGLRWQYYQPLGSKRNVLATFDPSVAGGALMYEPGSGLQNEGVIGPKGLQYPDLEDWSPRVGLAYALGDKTAIRSSYGMFYQEPPGNQHEFQNSAPPFVTAQHLFSGVSTPTLFMDSTTFFPPALPPFGGPGLSPFGFDPHIRDGYLQTWTMSVERKLPGGFLLTTAYIGSKGTHLDKREDFNRPKTPPPPGIPGTIYSGNPQLLKPYPNWGDVIFLEGRGTSEYEALQISARKPFSQRFSVLVSYSYSKATDTDSFDNKSTRVYIAGVNDRSPSLFDERQRLVISYIYQLPWSTTSFKSSAAGIAFGGWQVSGITTVESGFPFSPSTAIDYSERPSGFGWNLPNRICNGNLPRGSQTVTRWFDTSCFTTPAYDTLGNSGFEVLYTNGMINQDLALEKTFHIREPWNLQFKAEFFNIFNHPDFGTPDATVESPTFGRVFSALDGRDIQLSLKLTW